MVDEQIKSDNYGRLFAVVYINDKQCKVTTGDVLLLKYDIGCDIGEKICLEKVIIEPLYFTVTNYLISKTGSGSGRT